MMIKKIKKIWLLLALVSIITGISTLYAKEIIIYPTLPGTNIRDHSKPGAKIEGSNIYPTLPGTNIRDYSKPGATIERSNIYPTLPGTNIRDYSKPGYKIKPY